MNSYLGEGYSKNNSKALIDLQCVGWKRQKINKELGGCTLFFPCNGYSRFFPILFLNDNKKTLILYVHYLLVTICVGLISTFEHVVSLFVVLSTFFQIFIPAWSWYWVLFKDFFISPVLVLGLRLTIFWVV
jgi:hypothetical protein